MFICVIFDFNANQCFQFQKRSINVTHNNRCSVNNLKTTLNSSYSNDILASCSKLNSLSSNMMSVDKTIIDFSIQMVLTN